MVVTISPDLLAEQSEERLTNEPVQRHEKSAEESS